MHVFNLDEVDRFTDPEEEHIRRAENGEDFDPEQEAEDEAIRRAENGE